MTVRLLPRLQRLPRPYANLLLALLLQLCMLVVETPRLFQQPADILFTLWIGTAAASITGRLRVFWVALALGVTPALLELAVPFERTPFPLRLLKEGLWIVFPAYVAQRVLFTLFRSPAVTHHEVFGAVALYILIGMFFGNLFELVYDLIPAAVVFANLPAGERPQFADFLYLSFVTLTTTGYGDVAPVHPLARAVAMFEALVGLMYLSILVARVVAIHTQRSVPRRDGP